MTDTTMPAAAQELFAAAVAKHAGEGQLHAALKGYIALEDAGWRQDESGQWHNPAMDELLPRVRNDWTPPVEVQVEAQCAAVTHAEVDPITKALAAGEAITPQQVLQINLSLLGKHAEKWVARVIRKLDAQAAPDGIEIEGAIVKVDQSQHLVFGWFSVIAVNGRPVTDVQDDRITPEVLERSAYRFVLNSRKTGEMHTDKDGKLAAIAGTPIVVRGRLVESCVFTAEKQWAMRQSLHEQGIPAELDLKCVAWWGGAYIEDQTTWEKITTGQLQGWSLGGSATRVPV